MTKQRQPNPQPTPGVGSVIYLAPRSKEPRQDALYLALHDSGWRFDTVSTVWYTPIGRPVEFGRLEWNSTTTRAWIQPPSVERYGRHERPEPIAEFVLVGEANGGTWVDKP